MYKIRLRIGDKPRLNYRVQLELSGAKDRLPTELPTKRYVSAQSRSRTVQREELDASWMVRICRDKVEVLSLV